MEFTPVRCRIPDLLARIGKDQQWLADVTGKGPQKISDYVNLRTIMNLRTAMLFAYFLKCGIEDLYVWRQQK
ncbi:hypothetical protein ACX93W_26880 [Paenibacillus sp. CAU 1782]